MSLAFEKFHGLGNDFLVVAASSDTALLPEDAQRLCDRHFGVGADGVLIVSPTTEGRAKMTVLNADGSRPEMCGNGLRCVAYYLATKSGEAASEFFVQTDAGPRFCQVDAATGDDQALVRTSMGQGKLGEVFVQPFADEQLEFQRVSMGNPHAVCFRAPLGDRALDELGPLVSQRTAEGANVEIVTVRGPTTLEVNVWERGVGRTLACGTGAVGSVVVAAHKGLVPFGQPVTVRLPGGEVEILVTPELATSLLGPAAWVQRGETRLARLRA